MSHFAVDENYATRESAITAGVDDTLPVIAQGWFCGGFPESRFRVVPQWRTRSRTRGISRRSGSQNVQALRVTPGVAASSETVSHGGTATGQARSAVSAPWVRGLRPRGAAFGSAGNSGFRKCPRARILQRAALVFTQQMRSGWLAWTAFHLDVVVGFRL